MQPLVDRAAAVVNRIGRSAVPTGEVVRLLRESGVAVSESVLLRSLNADPERFRVIEPWRALRGAHALGAPAGGTTWIVPARSAARDAGVSPRRPALERLHATLLALGWRLDRSSATDVARWFGMVLEAERLSDRLPPEQRASVPAVNGRGAAAASATPRRRPQPPRTASSSTRPPAGRPTLLRERR
jgi:hypothetical protein